MSCKYAFIPCEHSPILSEKDILGSQRALYGELLKVVEDIPSNISGQLYRDDTDDTAGKGDYKVAADIKLSLAAEKETGIAKEIPVSSSGNISEEVIISGEERLVT